jgi:tol-pal system protein YbgF
MFESNRIRFAAAGGLAALAVAAQGQAPVTDPRQMDARISRLEQSLSSSSLLQMHQTLQNLERELRELRGEIEVRSHDIKRLEQRQRDLYLDVDRRMQALEAASGTPPAVAGSPPQGGDGSPAPVAALPAGPGPVAVPPGVPPSGIQPAVPAAPPPRGTAPPIASVTPPGAPRPATPGSTTAPGTPAAADVDPAAEQQAYRSAFELLKGGQFAEASAALSAFLGDYPNGRFSDNAQYWLGESYYVSRAFDPALKAFDRLLADFPDSPKRSHAMLKIGFIHDEMGRKDQARQVLTALIERYPQSTAASLAAKRLKRLKQR